MNGKRVNEMSLRRIAAELGVSHTLLVLWRQGKRSLAPELEARYHQLVTTGGYKNGYRGEVVTTGVGVGTDTNPSDLYGGGEGNRTQAIFIAEYGEL